MGRTGESQNKQAAADAASQQNAANAASMAAVNKYNSDLELRRQGKDLGQDPFTTPDYLSNLNRNFATSADATSNAAKAQLQDTALRTGTNSASTTAAIENTQRNAQRTANTGLNQQHANDYLSNIDYQNALLQGDLAPAGITNSLYGSAISGRNNADSNLTQFGLASYGPWNNLISAAGSAASGAASGYFGKH